MITVVDLKLGNVGSVLSMLRKVGVAAQVTASAREVANASALVLPGVGTFDAGMERIERLGLHGALESAALEKRRPLLGICLGMQLLTRSSEEGTKQGLGWVEAETVKIHPTERPLPVPHMGWNLVRPAASSELFQGLDEDWTFYFVHSYHVRFAPSQVAEATTHYGYEFPCALRRQNLFGVQFHPEKSHKFGIQFFKNFLKVIACYAPESSPRCS